MMKHNGPLKTLGPQAAQLVTSLHEDNKLVFRLEDVQRILSLEEPTTRSLVRTLVNRGVAARLKPGLFTLVPFELGREREYLGNPFIVARELAGGKDYFLSHGTAMSIHGMVTQPQLVVHVTTTAPRRPVRIMGTEFRFIASAKDGFFGLADHWVTKQEKIRISDPERTILDGLRMPEYCGGLTELAKGLWIKRPDLKVDRLVDYALRMDVGAVIRRLGYLLELYDIGTPGDRDQLRERLTDTYANLDPLMPAEGKYLRKWRLRLNVSSDELLSTVRT
jgi:predicted transcriptional regulator of viral defense system